MSDGDGADGGLPGAAEPRWLDAGERQAWLALMGLTVWLPSALDTQLRRDAGLTHFEYGVLAALSEAPDATMRMSDLAVLANASPSRLSRGVDRLERRGWVTRRPDPEDGRITLATLAVAGREVLVAAAPGHVAEARRLVLDVLTAAQVRQLAEIGRRILGAVAPECLPRCTGQAAGCDVAAADVTGGGAAG